MAYGVSLVIAAALTAALYYFVGWRRVADCMAMWGRRDYWTDYNIVEFAAWIAKAIIIVPGLVFGVQIWQLHFLTLMTSAALIWASMRKLLPTLVAFNTLWIALSTTVIVSHLWP
jgi:hypothetical protein